jgi:hypothetical protein
MGPAEFQMGIDYVDMCESCRSRRPMREVADDPDLLDNAVVHSSLPSISPTW